MSIWFKTGLNTTWNEKYKYGRVIIFRKCRNFNRKMPLKHWENNERNKELVFPVYYVTIETGYKTNGLTEKRKRHQYRTAWFEEELFSNQFLRSS